MKEAFCLLACQLRVPKQQQHLSVATIREYRKLTISKHFKERLAGQLKNAINF